MAPPFRGPLKRIDGRAATESDTDRVDVAAGDGARSRQNRDRERAPRAGETEGTESRRDTMSPNESPNERDGAGVDALQTVEGRIWGRRLLSKRNVLRLLILSFVLFPVVSCLLRI